MIILQYKFIKFINIYFFQHMGNQQTILKDFQDSLIDKYQFQETLTHEYFGNVAVVKSNIDDYFYYIKMIKCETEDKFKKMIDQIKNRIKSPQRNIINCKDFTLIKPKNTIYLIFEYVEPLIQITQNKLITNKKYHQYELWHILQNTVKGLVDLQQLSQDVNITDSLIFFDKDAQIKVPDSFLLGRAYDKFSNDRNFIEKNNVLNLGAILLQACYLQPQKQIYNHEFIDFEKSKLRLDQLKKGYSSQFVDIIKMMLIQNTDKRITYKDILSQIQYLFDNQLVQQQKSQISLSRINITERSEHRQ